jgi:replicative DNA helicase
MNTKIQEISTGFVQLDEIIGGFRAGQLITIGGNTGVGKSAFALNLALNIMAQGHKVGLWSFEMDKEGIFQRIFSIKTGIDKMDKSLQEERNNAVREYINNTDDDMGIYTDPIKDINNFYLQCRQLSVQENMKVVIIDYFQLISVSGESNNNSISEREAITKKLKNIASELGLVIIVVSQLTRACQYRDDKRPMLSDFRNSGSIEQYSNVVIFLHKLEKQPSEYSVFEHAIELIVAKNRSGLSGSFFLKYLRNTTKFIQGAN